MSIIQTIILAIVEGLTVFLPISSTGHLIITSSFMGIEKDEFVKLFEVAVQLPFAFIPTTSLHRRPFQMRAYSAPAHNCTRITVSPFSARLKLKVRSPVEWDEPNV